MTEPRGRDTAGGPGREGSGSGGGSPEADPDETRLAALYGLGDPPPGDEGGRNPFWWIWAFVIPFTLMAIGLMAWRILTSPQRVLPGM